MTSVPTTVVADIPKTTSSKPSTVKGVEISETNTHRSKASTPVKGPPTPGRASTPNPPRPRSNSTFKSESSTPRFRKKSNTFSDSSRPKIEGDASLDDIFASDVVIPASPYSHELIEGPEYLRANVVPKVLEAIRELMSLIKYGTIVPDPVQFLALKLKPELVKSETHSISFASKIDPKDDTVIEEATLETNENEVLGEDSGVLGKAMRRSMICLENEYEGLSEKEIKIKNLFNGEFY